MPTLSTLYPHSIHTIHTPSIVYLHSIHTLSVLHPYSICALSTLYPYSIQHFLLSIYRRAGFKRRCYTGFSPHLVCYRWLQYQSNIGETPSGQPTISRVKNALHPYSTHTPLIFYAHFIYTLSHSTCAPPILFPDDTHTP